MIATFKETIASVRDTKYGQVIIAKPFKSVLWYWTKYVLLLTLIMVMTLIVLLTRFLPEIPRLIAEKLPDGTLGAANHELYTVPDQTYHYGDTNFSFIFDLSASPSALDSIPDGMLVTKDRIVAKSSDGRFQVQTFDKLPDFSVDKHQIADWISSHRSQIWVWGLFLILILAAVITAIIWVYRLIIFLFWAAISWLAAKYLLKKPITYMQTLNIVIYSSIIPLLLSLILSISPNPILSLLNTGVFLFFVFSWIKNLPQTSA